MSYDIEFQDLKTGTTIIKLENLKNNGECLAFEEQINAIPITYKTQEPSGMETKLGDDIDVY